MFNKSAFVRKFVAATLALAALGSVAQAQNQAPLAWQTFRTDEAGFYRAPVLVTGKSEAVLIDSSFNFADGQKVADAIKASGRRLTTVYITTNDPDYYFGLAPVRQAFPDAKIIAAPGTVALMKQKAEGKIKAWSGMLGKNGPATVSELIFPQPSAAKKLTVDGQALEIINEPGLGDRGRYIWVPSLRAVFGGVAVFGGMYPWVADTPAAEERAVWRAALDRITARNPAIVVPGHATKAVPLDVSNVTFTRNYLRTFDAEAARAKDSAALIVAMKKHYPSEAMAASLELGAKVAKGEMHWGH